MRPTFAAFFTVLAFAGRAQDHLQDLRETIIDDFRAVSDSAYPIVIDTSNNRVSVLISGFETIKATYFFSDGEVCDSAVIRYECGKCLEKHLQDLLSVRYRKWVKIEEGFYLSQKWMSKISRGKTAVYGIPAMRVDPSDQEHTTVTLYEAGMSKAAWKEKLEQAAKE